MWLRLGPSHGKNESLVSKPSKRIWMIRFLLEVLVLIDFSGPWPQVPQNRKFPHAPRDVEFLQENTWLTAGRAHYLLVHGEPPRVHDGATHFVESGS